MSTVKIVDRYSHLNDTDAGADACALYLDMVTSGSSVVQAEVAASNLLQRSGYSVNTTGGASFERSGYVVVNDHSYKMDAVEALMDADICNSLAAEIAPCADQEFVDAYLDAHADKFGEQFAIN